MAKLHKQEPPFCIQIELVEGCNLRCPFCGLNGIREKGVRDFKMMTTATISEVGRVGQLWNARLELAMHGEPTMHADFTGMVRALREAAPKCQIMMTSNGGGLLPDPVEKIDKLFQAGLDVLALDEYDGIKIVSKVRAVKQQLLERHQGLHVKEYPADGAEWGPNKRHPKHMLPNVVFIADPSITPNGRTPNLNNHAGSGAPLNDHAEGRRCAKVFREVSVRWDGSVSICCNDWRGTYKCGNVNETPLEQMWQNAAFDAARRKLYRGERDFGPCKGCDALSFRPGLLPDPMGKRQMPPMDAAARKALAAAMEGPSYTAAVLRPWEPGYAQKEKQ